MVGESKNIWPNVQIDDVEVATLYEILWESGDDVGHGKEGYYFAGNGEHRLIDVPGAIGSALRQLDLAETDQPSSFKQKELDQYFNGVSHAARYREFQRDNWELHSLRA
ncbi:hypothetical protein BC628DRAFT_1065105 [Trametes gibbosa]|nr:hypothetical protein BC628DRAFT_1065105 [Trametes gibbosa]